VVEEGALALPVVVEGALALPLVEEGALAPVTRPGEGFAAWVGAGAGAAAGADDVRWEPFSEPPGGEALKYATQVASTL
jgi:hypothetical protein